MAPKKSGETFIVELRQFCEENGFYPRETQGSAGYRLIKCIRYARGREVFTADQLAEIDRMEGRYGMSTQSVRVSIDASALMNDLRHFYQINDLAMPRETRGDASADLARRLRDARVAGMLTEAHEAELNAMENGTIPIAEPSSRLAKRAEAFGKLGLVSGNTVQLPFVGPEYSFFCECLPSLFCKTCATIWDEGEMWKWREAMW